MSGDAAMDSERFAALLGRIRAAASGLDVGMASEPTIGTLAYLGDAVYELWVRSCLVARGQTAGASLHHCVVERVRAESQAVVLKQLEPDLTEQESDLVRRARNAKVGVVPKSASPVEYRLASAFEALLGHLLWHGQIDRLMRILALSESCDASPGDDD